MHGLTVTGYLLATTPWHVAEGAEGNLTRTMRLALIAGAGSQEEGAQEQPPVSSLVPFVPSNSIRGRLRRHCLGIVLESLSAREQTIKLPTFQMLANGGMLGGGDMGTLTVGEVVRARKHVFVGLWGGGPRMLASAVTTHDLLPVCQETIAAGLVPQPLLRFAPVRMVTSSTGAVATERLRAYQLVTRRMFKRNDDLMRMSADTTHALSVLGSDAEDKVAAYQVEQLGLNTARAEAKTANAGRNARTLTDEEQEALKKRTLTNYLELETISPGSVWPMHIELGDHVTPAQIGLVARALERFVEAQGIGSGSRKGYGGFQAYLRFDRFDEKIATLHFDAATGRHQLAFTDDSYDAALRDALMQLNGADLDAFAAAVKS
jgi:CRISPR type IV-associated protein Csf2